MTATAADTPDHPPQKGQDWTAAYIIIGLVPLVVAAIATFSVLLNRRRRIRRQGQGDGNNATNGQETGDIELDRMRRHHERVWFPWREAIVESGEELRNRATLYPDENDTSTAPGGHEDSVITADNTRSHTNSYTRTCGRVSSPYATGTVRPSNSDYITAMDLSRDLTTNRLVEPRSRDLGVRGETRRKNPFSDDFTLAALEGRPAPEPRDKTKTAAKTTTTKAKTKTRSISPNPFCHGYGIRRASDDRSFWSDNKDKDEDEAEMVEIDLGDGPSAIVITPEERERQERQRQREAWRERIRGLTREDNVGVGVAGAARAGAQGDAPKRRLRKYLGLGP